MILCILLNIYWKFNFNELDEKIKNSFSMPIFVICYTSFCNKCKNIKTQYNDFISISGNRTDMYTLVVNCLSNERICKYLDVSITPASILIIGNNSRYWPRTYSNQAEDWISFIDRYVNSNLKKIDIDDKKQLNDIVKKSTDNGGITYHLVVESSKNDVLRKIRRLAYHYRIYNVSFVYSINENIKNAHITRYYTKNCTKQFSFENQDVEHFINEVQFGPIHKYDYEEWKKLKSPKIILFTNRDFLLDSQRKGLIKLANKYINQISIGWTSTADENSKQFLDEFPLSDLPVNLIYDNTNHCFSLTKERTIDIAEMKFVDDFLNGNAKCNESYDDPTIFVNEKINKITGINTKKTTGKKFLIIYIISGLSIIGVLRLKQNDDEKGE